MSANLTATQVQLLKNSFRQLDVQAYSDYFYDTLFSRHPEVRALFPADMTELKIKLMAVFELVMFSFEEKANGQYALQDSLIVPLRHLGKTHEEKGVLPVHYSIANDLMLETLMHTLGKKYREDIQQAWQLALAHLTSAMLNNSVRLNDQLRTESDDTLRATFNSIMQKIKGYAK